MSDEPPQRIERPVAEWAKRRPARRFRFMMEPMGRALIAEQERDEAETERDALRAALAASEARTAALVEALIHRCATNRIDAECSDCQRIMALLDQQPEPIFETTMTVALSAQAPAGGEGEACLDP